MMRERIAAKHPVLVVVNPRAGRGAARRRAAQLTAALQRTGVSFVVRSTEHEGHARELAASAAGVVVAVGGDGTAHEVVNGLREHDGAIGPFSVLPAGSGDDFARNAGFDRDPHALARCLHEGHTSAIDVGIADVECEHGRVRHRFLNDAGLGFEADVVLATAGLRWLPGRLLYLAATLRAVRRQRLVDCQLDYDGADGGTDGAACEAVSTLFASACNGGRVGGGLRFAPAARLDDGRLDVLRVSSASALSTLALLGRLVCGRHGRDSRVRITRCRGVVMSPREPMPLTLDGEVVARAATRVHATVAPRSLVLAGLPPTAAR